MTTKPLILLGLNELNFEYVKHYAAQGHLPNFQKLFDSCPVIPTSSEKTYQELEPWIQWVSIQTGKPFEEHKIFRLGDVVGNDLVQIWEYLEKTYGIKVGALSPMNAANRISDPAFFIPDPWTKTSAKGDWLACKLAEAVANAVNENATGGNKLSTYFYVLLGVIRYAFMRGNFGIIAQILKGLKTHYQRAILLDQLLTDMFSSLWVQTRPGFSSLFLNSCAHLQHHYLYNSSFYTGPNKNPDWYMPKDSDPLLDGCKSYDALLAKLTHLPGSPRILITTGLHQTPVENPVFYWRLKNHSEFLAKLGINHKNVQPRMSRDFLIEFDNAEDEAKAQKILQSCADQNGIRIFEEIDARENSIFATLTYPHDIDDNFVLIFEGGKIQNFKSMIGFVALKNGEHDGEGYIIDTDNQIPDTALPITEIFGLIETHFSEQNIRQKAA